MDLPFEGTFDSDAASDALWELAGADDVAAAMAERLEEFLEDNEEYVDGQAAESALAVAALVATRLSGLAPDADEEAHHWLARHLFEVSDDLRELAASGFALALRYEESDWSARISPPQWHRLVDHLAPYGRTLFGLPQLVPDPFEPDLSEGDWFLVDLTGPHGPVPDEASYSTAVAALADAINTSLSWMEWWLPAGLQSLVVHARLDERPLLRNGAAVPTDLWTGLTRGRTTVRLEQPLRLHPTLNEHHLLTDLHTGLTRVAERLGLDTPPPLPPTDLPLDLTTRP
ncbi:DUF4259 domain-containing protein, partial [Actinocorallia lasiicapitis]